MSTQVKFYEKKTSKYTRRTEALTGFVCYIEKVNMRLMRKWEKERYGGKRQLEFKNSKLMMDSCCLCVYSKLIGLKI